MQELINKYTSEVYYKMDKYSQFIIDFIDELEDNYSVAEETEGYDLSTFIQAAVYQVENILEIIKDSEDKNLLLNLKQELELCKLI